MKPAEFYMRDRTLHPPSYHPGYKTSVPRSPKQALLTVQQSLSEITGPAFGHNDLGPLDHDLIKNFDHGGDPVGERIILHGRVLDENARPVPKTLVEIWQANHVGRYDHANDQNPAPLDPNFQGVARLVTGTRGEWRIRTIKPQFYDTPLGVRTPHIHFDVTGTAQKLVTQMYFPEETEANAKDFLYKDLGQGAPGLVAQRPAPATYRWDIVLMDAV